MCGIAGIFDLKAKRDIARRRIVRMNESQLHRGPDEGGIHLEPGVALGHRRLSIIDLKSGQQPLANEDGSVIVVFNGEIYNFLDLVPELAKRGHVFRTRCDTEVIVHAWEEWGEDCVSRFRGMFAFALFDRNRDTLFLARDRLGVKPLYYAEAAHGFLLFGSELKSLVADPGFSRDLDPLAIEDYFAYGYIPDPRSVFRRALKLPPACTLTIKRGEASCEPKVYWDVPFKPLPAISAIEAGEELIVRLREAVKIRLMSEVPLGAFLSGGVDSSAVVAMMAGLSGEPVNTCSIAFSDPQFNEAQHAEKVARRYATRHHVETVDSDDFALVDRLARLYDEPFADSSAMPTYRVCELAKKTVTVALSGDGGDEGFGGYRRYYWHGNEEKLRAVVPSALRRPLFGFLARSSDWAPLKAKTTFEAISRDSVEGYFNIVALMNDGLRERIFSPRLRRALNGYRAIEVMRAHAGRAPASDPLSLVQYLDYKTYLPGDINTKVDRASMAHSLEVREPLMDHLLVEWLSGLRPALKLKRGEGKWLFKKSLERYLPYDVLYRRKMGFAVPLATWFRGPLRKKIADAVLGTRLRETGFFEPSCLRQLIERHQSGDSDHSAALWSLLMFHSFLGGLDKSDHSDDSSESITVLRGAA